MKAKNLLPFILVGLLMGCSTVSKVSKDGYTEEPVFPELEKLTLQEGTWPNVENLKKAEQPGVTRDQLYDLLGRPHFKEGLRTREWDYLFHFSTPDGRVTCQFKVLFDTDKIAQSFHWAPEGCFPEETEVTETKFTLDGDVTFEFDSDKLTARGQEEVKKIAANLSEQDVLEEVVVEGYTDRLGGEAYNYNLSQRRAETVRRALIAEGIDREVLRAVGYGKERPVVHCDATQRNALISCLAPNRRVEITAYGSSSAPVAQK